MEKKSEVVNLSPTISAQEIKQKTKKECNLLTLTVSCEKMSCLIRSKNKNQHKTNKKKTTKKR